MAFAHLARLVRLPLKPYCKVIDKDKCSFCKHAHAPEAEKKPDLILVPGSSTSYLSGLGQGRHKSHLYRLEREVSAFAVGESGGLPVGVMNYD